MAAQRCRGICQHLGLAALTPLDWMATRGRRGARQRVAESCVVAGGGHHASCGGEDHRIHDRICAAVIPG